jgi:hypothetical protein
MLATPLTIGRSRPYPVAGTMLTLALFRYANPGGCWRAASALHAVDQLWDSFELTEGDHRTGFIPNTSVGLLKLPEPLDTSPQRQPHDRQPHHKAQYRNL